MQSKSTVFVVAVVLPVFAFMSARYFLAGPTETTSDSQPPPPVVAPVQTEALRFATVDDYFVAGNPNPISHLAGQQRFKRDVSARKRREIIERDGGCCVVCGSTNSLEVDHRRALMNLGDNSDANLGTLCNSCHVKKTRLDRSLNRKREKLAKGK